MTYEYIRMHYILLLCGCMHVKCSVNCDMTMMTKGDINAKTDRYTRIISKIVQGRVEFTFLCKYSIVILV